MRICLHFEEISRGEGESRGKSAVCGGARFSRKIRGSCGKNRVSRGKSRGFGFAENPAKIARFLAFLS